MCRVFLLVYVMVMNVLLSECIVNNKPNSCPPLKLLRGRVKYMQKGKFVKFLCNTGYTIAGVRYSYCIKGKWDEKVPICVKPSCSKVKAPFNGLIYPQWQGAVLNFFCNGGYALRGSQIAYCDGFRWSTNLPTCVPNGVEPLMACDFESEDMCGWTQDLNHDFDWRRYNFQTPSGHIGTGPRSDHTKGEGKDGYYVYIESTSRIENDSARLISPVYNKMERGICFTFYYHMYGNGIGSLIVYVKRGSQSYATKYLKPEFVESGNQGDVWKKGTVSLSNVNETFQIIIEGIRGKSYVSDIAIDDVNLTDYECDDNEFSTLSTTDGSTESGPIIETCLNRCNNDSDTIYIDSFVLACDCVDSCLENNSCCPDYIAICVLGSTDFTENYEIDTITTEKDYITTKIEASTNTPEALTTSSLATSYVEPATTSEEPATTHESELTTMVYINHHQPTGTTIEQPRIIIPRRFASSTTTRRPRMNDTENSSTSISKLITNKPSITNITRIGTTTRKPVIITSTKRTGTNLKPYILSTTVKPTAKPRNSNTTIKNNTNSKSNKTNMKPYIPNNPPSDASTTKTMFNAKYYDGLMDALLATSTTTLKPKVNRTANIKPRPKIIAKPNVTEVIKPNVSQTISITTKLAPTELNREPRTTNRIATLEIETDYTDSIEVILEQPTIEQVSKYAKIHSEPSIMSTHWIMGISCSIVFIMLVVVSTVFIARKYNVRLCNRFRFQNSRYSESMSDVRFLTNDEVLDFTWRAAHN